MKYLVSCLIGALFSLVYAVKSDGPRVVLYQESWAVYARRFAIWDLDDSVLNRKMPYKEIIINHAFLWLDKENCTPRTSDNWADFSWYALIPDSGNEADIGSIEKANRPIQQANTVGWFGLYNLLRSRYTPSDGVYIIPSFGGWSLSYFFETCMVTEKGNKVVDDIAHVIKYFSLDGVDFDWEHPGCVGGCGCQDEWDCKKFCISTNNEAGAGDWDKYFVFLKGMRSRLNSLASEMGKDKLFMSIAIGMNPKLIDGGDSKYPDAMPVEQMCEGDELDFINMMTYDYYGPWLQKTGPLAPLYSDSDPDSKEMNIHDSVTRILARCSKPEKLNMGLATYGKGWKSVSNANADNKGLWVTSDLSGNRPDRRGAAWMFPSNIDMEYYNSDKAAYVTGNWPWFDLVNTYLYQKKCKRYWNYGSETPTIVCDKSADGADQNIVIAYEDPESWYYKVSYAKASGLGGVIIWASGDMGGKYRQKNSVDMGKPLWNAIYRAWFNDWSISVGDAVYSDLGMHSGTQLPMLGDLSDKGCVTYVNNDEYRKTLCSCPLGTELRVTWNSVDDCTKDTLGMTCEVYKTLQSTNSCPNCGKTGGITIKSSSGPFNTPPASCGRKASQPEPDSYVDPLASYKQSDMGSCGDRDDGNNNMDDDDDNTHDDDNSSNNNNNDGNDNGLPYPKCTCRKGCEFKCYNKKTSKIVEFVSK